MASKLWAGLDVGVETTSLCVIDDAGAVLLDTICSTRVRDVHEKLRWMRRRRFARVALEASSLSIARGLRNLGYTVDLYETRTLSKFLRARRNKTDAGDAAGIAEASRVGASLVSKVHLKSLESQSLQSRLTIRRHLIRERVAAVNLLCRQIEHYGGRIRRSSKCARLRPQVESEIKKIFDRRSAALTSELRRLLDRGEQLYFEQQGLDRQLRREALENEVCRRFMQIPGVGPLCALTFISAIDEPQRFRRGADVGSYLGLTPRLHQSGLTSRRTRISKMGHKAARTLLVQSALRLLRTESDHSPLRSWAQGIEERRGRGRAKVAVARKLAAVMLAMWKSGESFRLAAPASTSVADPWVRQVSKLDK